MCAWGTHKMIHVIHRNNDNFPDGWHPMAVDACIADYVQLMNDRGIITRGCCCGHGKTVAQVSIGRASVPLLNKYGYDYTPYWGNVSDGDDYCDVTHYIPPATN